MRHLLDIIRNVHPVLICAPPAAGSAFTHSKCVFSNSATNQEGYPCLECIGGPSATPPHSNTSMKSIVTCTKPSQAYVDVNSADEDDDTVDSELKALLPPSKTSTKSAATHVRSRSWARMDRENDVKKVSPARRTHSRTRVIKQVQIIESKDEDATALSKMPESANSDDAKGKTEANGTSGFLDNLMLGYLKCISCRHHAFHRWQQRAGKGQEGKS